MRRKIITLLACIICAATASAQHMQLQGTVMHDGAPLAGATVMEIDNNHRILNQTYTDNDGHFSMKTTGGKTSLRVTAAGMYRFTQKIGNNTNWTVKLKKDEHADAPNKAKARYETQKLLVGRLNNRPVPQLTWVEQLTDTTFTLVLPVRMPTMVEEYPSGRKLTVTDFNGHVVALGECIEQATPEEGTPKSWDPFLQPANNNSVENESPFTTNDRDYFAYPRFSVTKTELEYLIDHSAELACFAVDTARGDNYWLYYPSTTFARELQKILNRMLK